MQVREPYTLGLDVGIASVGWCLLGKERIIDLGVRCFDRAEGDKGESKGKERRDNRSQRKRIRRRAFRMASLSRLLKEKGLIQGDKDEFFFSPQSKGLTTWDLRAKGLDCLLSKEEFARIIYHIVKHRGFLSTRKSELVSDDKELGRLSAGLSRTKRLMEEGGWRTPGEMAAKDPHFAEAKRNKAGDYKNTFDRNSLKEELILLFEKQREFGSTFADSNFEHAVLEIFSRQRAALSGADMLELIGKCTFEADEHRAAKATWTAERFVWLTKLNNLRISEFGVRRPLTAEERETLINLPYKTVRVKYSSIRKALKASGEFADESLFVGLSYGKEDKNPEDSLLIELKAWHAMKNVLKKAGVTEEWDKISADHELLDAIGSILSIFKTDEEILVELKKLQLSDTVIDALLSLSFTNFLNLSLKALNKLVPEMEVGYRYDEACERVGYNHYSPGRSSKQKYLPVIPLEEVRNPVVYRALNQTRKVLNTIIRRYGSPESINIELGRDISKSFDERQKVKRAQKSWQDMKKEAEKLFTKTFGFEPRAKNQDLMKFKLYSEQQGKCAYSLKHLDVNRLTEDGYVEIDHILPYSRSFDDSQNNKALVLTAENRNKKNQTPYEYLGGDNEDKRWKEFSSWVLSNRMFRRAKRERYLRKDFDERAAQEFRDRNLNDTRYIARFLKNFIEQNLLLAADQKLGKVTCVNGQFTAFLRTRWGLLKERSSGDKHHALDAAVIASATPSLIKRVSDFHRHGTIIQRSDGKFVSKYRGEVFTGSEAEQMEAKLPQPWVGFRDELIARLDSDPVAALHSRKLSNYSEEQIKSVHPIFVSRAPKRRNFGAVHKDTIRSSKYMSEAKSAVRVSLTKLSLKLLEDMVAKDDPRNAGLYSALKERLMEFNDDAEKAFTEPFYKPSGNGTEGPLVRSIKILSTQKGGVSVRSGIAEQASMIRADIFEKRGKFYAVPIYQSDRVSPDLPNRAVVAYKAREEWPIMDESFSFACSLHPNDLVRLEKKEEEFFGYYAGLDVATGAISILYHDRDATVGKNGLFRGLGIKTAKTIQKFHVDPLGRVYSSRKETRHGLA